jgi:hypothetical protein
MPFKRHPLANKNKTGQWYIGPRSAWDYMPIGPFKTHKSLIEYIYQPFYEKR